MHGFVISGLMKDSLNEFHMSVENADTGYEPLGFQLWADSYVYWVRVRGECYLLTAQASSCGR